MAISSRCRLSGRGGEVPRMPKCGNLESIKAILSRKKVKPGSFSYDFLKVALRNRDLDLLRFLIEENLVDDKREHFADALYVNYPPITE